MSENHSPRQKKDVWKTKYLDSLDQLEALERNEDLLKRTIQRLILAARGQDPRLDRQLNLLRHALSQKLSETTLQRSHEGLSKALIRLDEKKQTAAENGPPAGEPPLSGADLGELLDGLSWPKPHTRKAKVLAERFRALGRSEDPNPLFRELSRMFGEVLATAAEAHPADHSPGLFQRLFGARGPGSEQDLGSAEDRPATAPPDPRTRGREPPPRDSGDTVSTLFSRFLNKVRLPPPASAKVDELRRKLEQPAGSEDQADLLLSFADFISDSCANLHQERSELEEFLRNLTERLRDIDRHIQQVDNTHTLSARSNEDIQQSINAEVDHMRSSVETAADLATLKGAVSRSLDTITTHMESYILAEEARREQDRTLTTQLMQRMLKLQDEADRLKENISRERKQAVRDPLTALPNRVAYDERLQQEFVRWKRYRTPLSMAVVDIDRFKEINDDFGHQAGDKALRIVAEILVKKLRETDFIARYGGDEFVVLMPETTIESAAAGATKLLTGVADCGFHFHGRPVPITLSIGVSAWMENDTPDRVFARADAALYAAKEAGRNCVRTSTP